MSTTTRRRATTLLVQNRQHARNRISLLCGPVVFPHHNSRSFLSLRNYFSSFRSPHPHHHASSLWKAALPLLNDAVAARNRQQQQHVTPCQDTRRRNLWSSKSTREEEEKKKLGIVTTNDMNSSDDVQHQQQEQLVLYDRGPGRLRMLRWAFGFSCFHTAYWLWFSTVFVPAINESPVVLAGEAAEQVMSIDPVLPTVGIVFSVIIQSIFTLYPRYLVSRLTWSPTNNNEVSIYTHTILPIIRPEVSIPMRVVPVGQLKLDPASKEAQQIMNEFGGDLTRFKGHVGVTAKKGQWPPFLLDFRGETTAIPEPEILLEILLNPDALIRDFENGNMVVDRNNNKQCSRKDQDDDNNNPSYRVQVARGASAVAASRRRGKSKKQTRQRRESQLGQIAKRRR